MRARTKHSCGSSATLWRHADHSVLLVCAMVAWGTAHGQASPDDAMRLQPAEALAAGGQPQTSRVKPGSQLDVSRGFGLQAAAPASRDSLFADDDTKTADKPRPSAGWRGFIQGEAAYSYRDPKHWSKGRVRAELSRQGQFSENVKWKIGARADYDAVYDN